MTEELIVSEIEVLLELREDTTGDEIDSNIRKILKDNQKILKVEFILESLTKLGYAFALLYDDNARFAITGDGFNSTVTEKEKINGSMISIVSKKQWKKTIRKALKHFLKDIND